MEEEDPRPQHLTPVTIPDDAPLSGSENGVSKYFLSSVDNQSTVEEKRGFDFVGSCVWVCADDRTVDSASHFQGLAEFPSLFCCLTP